MRSRGRTGKEIDNQAVFIPDRLHEQFDQIYRLGILEHTFPAKQFFYLFVSVGYVCDDILQRRLVKIPDLCVNLIPAAGSRQHDQIPAFPCDFFTAPSPGMVLMNAVAIRMRRQFDASLTLLSDLSGRDLLCLGIVVNGEHQIGPCFFIKFTVMVVKCVADGKLPDAVFADIFFKPLVYIFHSVPGKPVIREKSRRLLRLAVHQNALPGFGRAGIGDLPARNVRHPGQRVQIIAFSENIIADQFQVCILVIIDGNEDNPVLPQQFTRQLETRIHKSEPCGMRRAPLSGQIRDTRRLFLRDMQFLRQLRHGKGEPVVVDKPVRPGIVRRININTGRLSRADLQQMLEPVQIISRDIQIPAVSVFRLCVMLFIRNHDGFRIDCGKHLGIILSQELQFISFIGNIGFGSQDFRKMIQIKRAVCVKAGRKMLSEYGKFLTARTSGFSFSSFVAHSVSPAVRCNPLSCGALLLRTS